MGRKESNQTNKHTCNIPYLSFSTFMSKFREPSLVLLSNIGTDELMTTKIIKIFSAIIMADVLIYIYISFYRKGNRSNACLVVNRITVDNFASLSNCTSDLRLYDGSD